MPHRTTHNMKTQLNINKQLFPTIQHFSALLPTQPANKLSSTSRKQPKTQTLKTQPPSTRYYHKPNLQAPRRPLRSPLVHNKHRTQKQNHLQNDVYEAKDTEKRKPPLHRSNLIIKKRSPGHLHYLERSNSTFFTKHNSFF